jgi:ectoine hydroxylase-related dioxygenase (phytanoyl-CoA dioxygenase family)
MTNPLYKDDLYMATTKDELKHKLDTYGVAIVPNVLNAEECAALESGMWADIEHITQQFDTPIKKNDPNTWNEWYKLYPKHAMLMQNYQIGHTQTVWDVRQNPKVVKPFTDIWNVQSSDLLCSFDGISFHMPPEQTNRGWFRNNWLHTDQSYTRNKFECIQGWVTANEVRDGDGTLTFLKGSHKYHKDAAVKFNITDEYAKFSSKDKEDWVKLTPEQQYFYTNECNCVQECIKCPAGSMVLWDSRTIHCGREPTRGREKENIRCIAYVCMTPRSLATSANLRKKTTAFEELRMTTHWPHKPKLFGKHPRTYGGPLPNVTEINPPILAHLGRRLAGYE